MRLTLQRKGRTRKMMRRIMGGAVLATGLVMPMLGLTTTSASAITCPTYYTPSSVSSSNVCLPIYPGTTGSYPASTNTYPQWLEQGTTGTDDNQSVSNIDRSVGSDTTLFMMQALGNLYNDAGLYGCNMVSTEADCENDESTSGATSAESDIVQTDTVDNFNRTEILNGINNIGSGNGLKQLCGTQNNPDASVTTFARSSKPPIQNEPGSCVLGQVGYAKDGVASVDFQELAPGAFGSPSYYCNYSGSSCQTNLESGITGGVAWPSGSNGEIGAPAAGWEPGNPDNCVAAGSGLSGTPCSGTPFLDVDNTPIISSDGQSSIAYRLWCQNLGTTNNGTDPRIVDWGQLTNLSTGGAATSAQITSGNTVSTIPVTSLPQALNAPLGTTDSPQTTVIVLTNTSGQSQYFNIQTASAGATSLTVSGTAPTASATFPAGSTITYSVGDGSPIGVPIHIVGINSGSGTVATFSSFANSGTGNNTTSSCGSGNLMDVNSAEGPDPVTPTQGSGATNPETAVENNASQIATFAAADFPNDLADQAVAVATSLYAESNGVYLSNTNAGLATLVPGTSSAPSGVPLTYTETEMTLNGVTESAAANLNNSFPTARTLFNAYLPSNLNASVGAFFNWMCDANSYYEKATDLTTGKNYSAEIKNIIVNQYEYQQLTDTRLEVAGDNVTPADGVTDGAPNSTCDAQLPSMVVTGSNTLEYEPGSVATNIPSAAAFTGGDSDCTSAVSNAGGCPTVLAEPQAVDSTSSGWPSGITVNSVSTNTMTVNLNGASLGSTGTSYNLYFPGMPPILNVTNPNN